MLPAGANHIYSYSQLTTAYECPYAYYLEKIEKEDDGSPHPQKSNFFSEQGTLIHDLMEAWAKGELKPEEMAAEYERLFPEVVVSPLPAYMKRDVMYNKGLAYCETFKGFPGYIVESAEEKFIIDLPLTNGETRKFTGRIDLILKDVKTDEIIIVDHKSKSAKTFKAAEDEMYRQQYMYAAYVKEKYGRFPDRLMFNLFKEPDNGLVQRVFSQQDYDATLAWATDTIKMIESNEMMDWLESKEEPDFFCNNICSVRDYCPNGVLETRPKGRRKG